MEKLWAGRTDGSNAALADAFNRSIAFDARMAEEDITGSMAQDATVAIEWLITEVIEQGQAGDHYTPGACFD